VHDTDVIQSKWIYIDDAFCSNMSTKPMQNYKTHHRLLQTLIRNYEKWRQWLAHCII